jgi:hypothetical protein
LGRDATCRCNGGVGWLPREEVTLLFGALAALGCLSLGVLELIWPTGGRRVARPRATPAGQSPAQVRVAVRASDPARLATLVQRALAERDLDRRVIALRVAILTLERWHATRSADETVTPALERARVELWADYERIAMTRLASTMPWRAAGVPDSAPV